MKITEVNMSIFSAPQGYYAAGAISRDLNFSVGLPALYDKTFNIKKRFEYVYGESDEIEVGKSYSLGNLFLLVVKDSSYDSPNKKELFNAIENMRDIMEYESVGKLAMPKICCGKNGLEWEEVERMLEMIFGDSNVEILVCCQ